MKRFKSFQTLGPSFIYSSTMITLCAMSVACSFEATEETPVSLVTQEKALKGSPCFGTGLSDNKNCKSASGAEPNANDDTPKHNGDPIAAHGRLYFHESFNDKPQPAWRYECRHSLPHSSDDLDNIRTLAEYVESSEEANPGDCQKYVATPFEKWQWPRLGCCSPSSGLTEDYWSIRDGSHDLDFSGEHCKGLFRTGYCPTPTEGTQRFVSWPTDIRRLPSVSDAPNKKGGAELAIIAENTAEKPHPQMIEISPSSGEIVHQGWDPEGTSFLKLGETTFYGFRIRVNDASMLTEKLAESAFLFQFHSKPSAEKDLRKDDPHCESISPLPTPGHTPSPLAALLLKYDIDANNGEGALELRFNTKSPNHPYYQRKFTRDQAGNLAFLDCGKECQNTFWTARLHPAGSNEALEVGKWMTFVVEVREGGQRDGFNEGDCDVDALLQALCAYCDPDDVAAKETAREAFEVCKPSDGYLALYVNGERVISNVKEPAEVDGIPVCGELQAAAGEDNACSASVDPIHAETLIPRKRTLPWIYGQDTFYGLTTRFNTCPNYLKVGQYVLKYDYTKIHAKAQSWTGPQDVPVLDTEIDWIRAASSLELAAPPKKRPPGEANPNK